MERGGGGGSREAGPQGDCFPIPPTVQKLLSWWGAVARAQDRLPLPEAEQPILKPGFLLMSQLARYQLTCYLSSGVEGSSTINLLVKLSVSERCGQQKVQTLKIMK